MSRLPGPSRVYWAMDAAGVVLYVGMTGDIQKRIRVHRSRRAWRGRWFNSVVAWRATGELPQNSAAVLERRLIQGHEPIGNNQSHPALTTGKLKSLSGTPLMEAEISRALDQAAEVTPDPVRWQRGRTTDENWQQFRAAA